MQLDVEVSPPAFGLNPNYALCLMQILTVDISPTDGVSGFLMILYFARPKEASVQLRVCA